MTGKGDGKMRDAIRKAGALLLAVAVICMMIPAQPAMADQTGTVFGGWLILRSAPSFSGAIKSSYPTGTVVTITGQNGSWYAVKTPDGLTGYMLGSYLKVSGSSTPSGSTAWVTSQNGLNVRLRTGPGTGYSILASYAPGTKCTVISAGSNWSRIQIGSYTGYMMSKYLTNTDPGSGGYTPSPAPAPAPGGYSVWVTSQNGKGVNLRSGPSKSYSAIGFYGVGTAATMISAGAQWSYIQIGNRTGYMMSQFLTTSSPAPAPVPPTPVGGAYVISGNGKSVNLRTGPGKGYPVIRSFAVGTPLTIITKGTDWCFIHIGGVYGYMMTVYIHDGGILPPPAPTPEPTPAPTPATKTDL